MAHHRSALANPVEHFLTAPLLLPLAASLLLASPTLAEHIGNCYDDKYCVGKLLSSVSGDPKPNNEIMIKGYCVGFRSDIGPPYKADLCTATACTRLAYNLCYNRGGYKSVEFVQ